jgi:AcrR family transcriptional regulator
MRAGNEAKDNIIKAARAVVSEQGVQKATLRAIAAEAGISIGTLYYYYPSKNDLLYDIIDSHTSESFFIAEAFKNGTIHEEMGEEGLANYLTAKIKERIDGIEDNRILFYLIQEAIMGNDDIKENIQKKYRLWIDSIDTIVTEVFRVPASKTSRATAMIINAAIDGFMLKKLLGLDERDSSHELEEVGRLLLRGSFDEYAEKITKGKGEN